ncbi:MAG TPA: hypothetical protein VF875_10060, partial [Anaeromyxobacter sp.]
TGVPATIVRGTVNAGLVTLALDVSGGLSGSAVLWDDVGGIGTNATSIGAQVAIAGTSFTGLVWIPAPFITPASGAWSFTGLPPGTYDVVVSSTGRNCATGSTLVVASGATTSAGAFRCTDAVAPGAVGLGQPLPTGGGISGWVSGTTVTIPIAQAATDGTSPTSNLRGYQVVVGAAPSWDAATLVPVAPTPPTQLTAGGLAANATNVVWVRALDWVGNVGPASSVAVQQDSNGPTAPTITAPKVVSDLTATVVFTGADADPSFLRYEACTATVASTSTCNPSPTCSFAAVPQSDPVALPANQRTCLWAQTVDKAGRTSATVGTSIVNDSAAPSPPIFRPSYDPAAVTVRAEWVDFFLATAPTDAAWGPSWKGIAWIEVDRGHGYEALCPAAACHANDTYTPCGCGCSDGLLRCDGTTFTGLRIPLASESVNSVAFRSVDLAGNAGNGLSQDVATEATAAVVAATIGNELLPSIAGNVVTWQTSNPVDNSVAQVLLDLGSNRHPDASDPTCSIPNAWKGVMASRTLLVYSPISGDIVIRRPAAGASFCGVGTDTTTSLGLPAVSPYQLAASGERVAWSDNSSGNFVFKVREPGPNASLGDPDDVTTTLSGPTFTANWNLQLAGTQLLARTYTSAVVGGYVHRIWSAPTGFGSNVSTFDLAMYAGIPSALSPDGKMLAYVSGGSIVIQLPTNGRYTAGDAKASKALPPGFSTGEAIAIDGTHLVLADVTGGAFVHWDAGADGTFGTGDDLYATFAPSKTKRPYLALSSGILVYSENSDIFSRDLTSVRWEDVPAGYNTTGPTMANASGSVFFGGYNSFGGSPPLLTARCPSGRDTSNGTNPVWFAASGDYLTTGIWGSGVYLHTRDTTGASPSGCFFTGSSTTRALFGPAQDATYGSAPLATAVLGDAVLVGNWPWGTPDTRIYVLEPHVVGSTIAASGADPVLVSTNIQYPYGLGLTPKQAVYFCGRSSGGYQICVKGKGTVAGLFRDSNAPAEQVLVHPSDAAKVADRGTTLQGQHVKVGGNRLVVNTYTSGTVVVDAGIDAVFNTSDDHETTLVPYRLDGADYAIAGSWVAYVDAGSPGGDQIYLFNAVDHTVQQLTFHVSAKTNVSVDASGRTWWEDSVFGSTWSVWVRTP